MTKGQRGQSLFEVLGALGVAVVVLTAIVATVLGSLSTTQFSKNQNVATLYGQQGMEIVRELRNRGWSTFSSYNGTFCLPGSGVLASGSCSSTNTLDGMFTRQVRFEDAGVVKRVTVTVSFTDQKGVHSSELISSFTDWNVVPSL